MSLLNYILILEEGTYQTWKLICILGIRTETRQGTNAVHCSRGTYLFTFIYV